MKMRCWAEIDGAAIRNNLRVIRKSIPRSTAVMAVVKANAYGHGMIPVARESLTAGTQWLGTANVDEAILLRKSGIKSPILVLSPALKEEMNEAIQYNLILTLSSFEEARWLNHAAKNVKKKARAHFKIDTGMGRAGIWHEHAKGEIEKSKWLPNLKIEGIYTHFASSDSDELMTARQWKIFENISRSYPHLIHHAANSHALISKTSCAAHIVRAGIMLYGSVENESIQKQLKPVMTWKSRIVLLRRVGAGRTVSYGATYRLPKAQTLATIAVGYADGYKRLLSNCGEVLVHGKRCPVRGRVTMDQIVIDVTTVPHAKMGDDVTLLGRDGNEEILAQEMANWAKTISYEIFTSVGPRVTRIYKNFNAKF